MATVRRLPDVLRFFADILFLNVRLHLFTHEDERLQYCPVAFILGIWRWSLGFYYGLDARRSGHRGSSLRIWLGSLVDIERFARNGWKYGHTRIGKYKKCFDNKKRGGELP
jgi:hypothetical protein